MSFPIAEETLCGNFEDCRIESMPLRSLHLALVVGSERNDLGFWRTLFMTLSGSLSGRHGPDVGQRTRERRGIHAREILTSRVARG